MEHTAIDLSNAEHVGQWEDTDGLTLVVNLDNTGSLLADALGILDVISLDTLDGARAMLDSGEHTLDTINNNGSFAWIVDLSQVEVSA